MGHALTAADTGHPSAAEQAASAVALASADAHRAVELAGAARVRARSERDLDAASVAERALGLALKELSDVDGAVVHLRRAIALARRGGLPERAAEARMSLSLVLAYRGETRDALRQADLAAGALRGLDAARAEAQRALILQRLGRLDDALVGYRRALAAIRSVGDPLWEARLLGNRGVLHAYRGALGPAEADLLRAAELFASVSQDLAEAGAWHNLGFVAARRGDVPGALAWYDRADARYRELGVPRAVLLSDRCDLLLSARLVAEARQAASEAVAELERHRMASDLAEARVLLAQAALLDGDPEAAREQAGAARRAFARQRRPAWAALAGGAELQAAWRSGERSLATFRSARRTADALADAGWPAAALDARLVAARTALALGRLDLAATELRAASRARDRGPVELRARAWHAEALLRSARDDDRGAQAALAAGLRVVDRHRATLGATELRAHAFGHGAELAADGLRLAVASGRPARVLAWAERWRAGTLRLRPVQPPDDDALARDLAELRRVVAEAEQAALAGADVTRLRARQTALERAVQQRARQAAGGEPASAARPPQPAELAAVLGDRVLVELVEVAGTLHAVVLADGRLRLRPLGPAAPALAELRALRFSLRRLATSPGHPTIEAHAASAGHAGERLDDLLVAPLHAELDGRPLVVVPTGELHAVPWGALPGLAGRPVTVAPSAATWLRVATAPPPRWGEGARVALAAGPGLPYAAREVDALGALYRGATRLEGDGATADAVARSLDGADCAHVAAHGSFRADNPLFSSLELADGRLTVYELERLRRAPRQLVLSACDSGLSAVHAGDELMGLTAALFALGTETLLATVVPVRDDVTCDLMLAVHERLGAGLAPAAALAAARDDVVARGARPADVAGVVCFGAG